RSARRPAAASESETVTGSSYTCCGSRVSGAPKARSPITASLNLVDECRWRRSRRRSCRAALPPASPSSRCRTGRCSGTSRRGARRSSAVLTGRLVVFEVGALRGVETFDRLAVVDGEPQAVLGPEPVGEDLDRRCAPEDLVVRIVVDLGRLLEF